jgi:hypothetical protein
MVRSDGGSALELFEEGLVGIHFGIAEDLTGKSQPFGSVLAIAIVSVLESRISLHPYFGLALSNASPLSKKDFAFPRGGPS